MPDPMTTYGLASAGGRLIGHFFGGRGERGYEMSSRERTLYDYLAAQLKDRKVPASVTAPFIRGAKNIQQRFSRRAGTSAKEHTLLQSEAYTPMAEASGQYLESRDARIQALMASLVGGTGTQTFQEPLDIGGMSGDIGFALAMAGAGKPGAVGTGGGGLQYEQGFLGYDPYNMPRRGSRYQPQYFGRG